MTKLETVALETLGLPNLRVLRDGAANLFQELLDHHTSEIMSKLTKEEVLDHVREVYDATADEYANNPHHRHVTDDLIDFMNRLPDEGGRVLEIGCGTGRDAMFMACYDSRFRDQMMHRKDALGRETIAKYQVPKQSFLVTALDNSSAMLAKAEERRRTFLSCFSQEFLTVEFLPGDVHDPEMVSKYHQVKTQFDGIWSCAALFTHSPKETIGSTMARVAAHLKPNGILAISYTNGDPDQNFDKLLISSTGRIKYFSHPDPLTVQACGSGIGVGLRLIRESYDDFMPGTPREVKSLFVSQVFKKDA